MKIGFFITARLKSSRLKRKILLDLNGKSILDRVINRAKRTKGIDGIVLCTSTNPQDSALYENALNNNIQFYPGSEDDVLLRLYSAARYYGYDAFLSITADNPLHSFYNASIILNLVKNKNIDFSFYSGVPLGVIPYYIKTNALEVALSMKKESNTEIWGPFVNRPDFFNILDIEFNNISFPKATRLTCDYYEDYNLLRQLYAKFQVDHEPTLFEIRDIIYKNIELLDINSERNQTSVSEKTLQEIKDQFDKSKRIGFEIISQKKYTIKPGYSKIVV